MINNLSLSFEVLWPKILPPDLKTFVHFFFAHPLGPVKQWRQDKTDGGRQCLGDFFIVHTSKVNLGLKENKKKL